LSRETGPSFDASLAVGVRGADPAVKIRIRDLGKTFALGRTQVDALRGIDLDVGTGEFICIVEPPAAARPRCCESSPNSSHPRRAKSPSSATILPHRSAR